MTKHAKPEPEDTEPAPEPEPTPEPTPELDETPDETPEENEGNESAMAGRENETDE
jgi:hypothetical protein